MTTRSSIKRILLLSATAAGMTFSAAASAEDDGYPLVYGQRPIVLTKGLSQIEAAFNFTKLDISDVRIGLNASFDYGILDNLTAGVLAMPLSLSPESDYGNPSVYGTYRFLEGAFDLGAHLRLNLPVNSGDFSMGVGAVGRFFLNDAAFVNVGALLGVTFGDATSLGLSIPVELGISFTRNIFFSVDTGFTYVNFDTDAWAVPLGVGVGYSLEGVQGSPMLDLYLKFGLTNAIGSSGAFEDLSWQALLGGRFYL